MTIIKIIPFILLSFGVNVLQEEPPKEPIKPQEEKKQVLFEFTKTVVRSYDKLAIDLDDAAKIGYVETFESNSHLLLEIDATITPNWTEDLQRINIDTKQITLSSGGGKPLPMVGGFTHGYFERKSWNSFSAYRHSKWKESKSTVPYNAVFLVPKEAEKFTLQIGDISTNFVRPEKPSEMPLPANSVSVEVLTAKQVDEIPGGDLSRDVKQKSIIRPMGGVLLEVTIKVSPREGNSTMDEHFFWHTPWIGLMAGKHGYCPTLGERWGTGISSNVSHNKSNYSGEWGHDEVTFYFVVPKGVTEFQITWLLAPVAKGTVLK